jgi:hypothetical protein
MNEKEKYLIELEIKTDERGVTASITISKDQYKAREIKL